MLEEVFLIKRVPAWSRNLSTRAIGTPKVAMVDSGVAANLLDADAGRTVRAEDFRGPRHLAERLDDDFVVGIVLYTGEQTLPFGPRLRAMPVSALWQTAP